MSARGFLGAGDLYIARYNIVTASFDAYKGPFEAGKYEIKPNTDTKDLTSKSRNNYGGLLESVNLPKPFDFTAELRNIDTDAVAIAMLGTLSALTQASGSVLVGAPEAVTVTETGKWYPLAHKAVAAVVVKDVTNATTYVLGTDYLLNAQLGWIQAIAGGGIDPLDVLHVSYTYPAFTASRIKGGTSTQIRAKLMLDGINYADSSKCIVEALEVTVAASSPFDFLADNFNTLTLGGRMKTPVGGDTPFTVDMYPTA